MTGGSEKMQNAGSFSLMLFMINIPINMSASPMAGLLVYLDTWDDYRRKGPSPTIFVREYVVDSCGASVTVEWADSESLDKEQLKYRAFESALSQKPFALRILPCMAGS